MNYLKNKKKKKEQLKIEQGNRLRQLAQKRKQEKVFIFYIIFINI
jgi:hypothetical protein